MSNKEWKWNARKELAAHLLALGDLSSVRIAQRAGIAESTLFQWKHAPEFQQRIEENAKQVNRRMKKEADAEFQARRKSRQELLAKLNQVVDDLFTLRTDPLKALGLAMRLQNDLDAIYVKGPSLRPEDVVLRQRGRKREMLIDVDGLTAQLMQGARNGAEE